MVESVSERDELMKKVIHWMKENVEPNVEAFNIYLARETKEIYIGSRNLLAATLIGVVIGVLTNISAECLVSREIPLGLATLLLSFLIALLSFLLWRFYLIRDLRKYVKKVFYERGKSLAEKFRKDFGILSSEEKSG